MFNRTVLMLVLLFIICLGPAAIAAAEAPVSDATQECLDCHAVFHPGIVADWRQSRHAVVTPGDALGVEGLSRKISGSIPGELKDTAVGCAECHTIRNEQHADAFEHNGTDIHVVVSSADCAVCHSVESDQYSRNLMSHAYNNLNGNELYRDLERTILGRPSFHGGKIGFETPDELTRADACYYCHGTKLRVEGTELRETDAGELPFPVIKGWPNQGVGRINLDGSRGSCSSCHTRHAFSIEMARKPYTCKECHVGPDVPAFKVYTSSKHGNIFSAMNSQWDFKAVPWTVGKDFSAPTCAVCHMSLTVDSDGVVVSERTHQMNDRLSYRIFGLIYAHPHPTEPDTTVIRNKDGLPLPTDFSGGIASAFLIDGKEQRIRRQTMQRTCKSCHDTSWVQGYFTRLDNTIATSNAAVQTATAIVSEAWKNGYAQGPAQKGSPFDEYIERSWTNTWLLYANNVRFVSAMAGGGDYGVFEDGRYHLTNSLIEMQSWMELREMAKKGEK